MLSWDVGKINPQKLPSLKGTMSLQAGASKPDENPTINLQFKIQQLAISGEWLTTSVASWEQKWLSSRTAGSPFMELGFITWWVILSKIFSSISGESSSSFLWSWLKWSDCQCIRHSWEGNSVGRRSVGKQVLSHPGVVRLGFPRFSGWEASVFSAGDWEEEFLLLSPRFRRTFIFAFITMWNPREPAEVCTYLRMVMMIVTAYQHLLCSRHCFKLFSSMLLFNP